MQPACSGKFNHSIKRTRSVSNLSENSKQFYIFAQYISIPHPQAPFYDQTNNSQKTTDLFPEPLCHEPWQLDDDRMQDPCSRNKGFEI